MKVEPTAISRARPADLIPGYQLERLVGKGGMGEVHKAVQLSLGRTVAVKLLSPELAQDSVFVTRFEKEAAALAALSHPNIVSIVDKGKAKGTYFLVMEYVDGPSLREKMRSPLFDIPGALDIGLNICRAVEYAHSRGVVHRDLKPENILFDEQAGGIPKVSDFGLASFLAAGGPSRFNLTEAHVSMGTLSYMAPEQRVDAKSADHRADIFSLGAMLYELFVGEVPLGNFDPPSQRKAGLDPRLDGIIARCLRPNPAERYVNASELCAELEPLAPNRRSQWPRKLSRRDRAMLIARSALKVAGRVAAALVVAAAATVLLRAALRGHGPVRLTTADALVSQLPTTGPLSAPGRIAAGADQRKVSLGEGPDLVPLVALGGKARFVNRALWVAPADGKLAASRVALDLSEGDANQVQASVEVSAQPDSALLTRMRNALFSFSPEPRMALVLAGTTGRYATLVVPSTGGPITLEWALGERRGTMSSPSGAIGSTAHLELTIDSSGKLRAFLGSGRDRRSVAEPIELGADWKKQFGQVPSMVLACIEAGCEFRKIAFESRQEPPPPPPPVAEPAPTKPLRTVPGVGAKKPAVQKKNATKSLALEKRPKHR